MDGDIFSGEHSSKHELERLEKKLLDFKEELYGSHEHDRGRSHKEIEEDMLAIEAQIRLLTDPPQEEL